ncbi:hypothetical protein HUJ04_008350 [Dendroctonus ponderosae]|nr:hypothetical protein HUJ04_008350 [Dendroctonus ponderosae]
MWYLGLVLAVFYSVLVQGNNLLEECAKFYRPKNYIDVMSQSMPYMDQLLIPDNLKKVDIDGYRSKINSIQPTPVVTTRVLQVKTKYVYVNPVCVKYSSKQKLCKHENRMAGNINKLITKEYFLKGQVEQRVESAIDVNSEEYSPKPDKFSLKVSFDRIGKQLNPLTAIHPDIGLLEPSESEEEYRSFGSGANRHTPSMTAKKVQEMLIEDRLDQLETILPNYHRKRIFETSTMYVTKTLRNKRSMATLVVKNCIPVGFDICVTLVQGALIEPSRVKRGIFGTVTSTVYQNVEEKIYVPASCVYVAPNLPECRNVRFLNARFDPTSIDSENNSIEQTPTWGDYFGFYRPTVTVTSIKIDPTTVVDTRVMVTYDIRGCKPHSLPFELPKCIEDTVEEIIATTPVATQITASKLIETGRSFVAKELEEAIQSKINSLAKQDLDFLLPQANSHAFKKLRPVYNHM